MGAGQPAASPTTAAEPLERGPSERASQRRDCRLAGRPAQVQSGRAAGPLVGPGAPPVRAAGSGQIPGAARRASGGEGGSLSALVLARLGSSAGAPTSAKAEAGAEAGALAPASTPAPAPAPTQARAQATQTRCCRQPSASAKRPPAPRPACLLLARPPARSPALAQREPERGPERAAGAKGSQPASQPDINCTALALAPAPALALTLALTLTLALALGLVGRRPTACLPPSALRPASLTDRSTDWRGYTSVTLCPSARCSRAELMNEREI